MIKVLIVDDEMLIRVGIKSCIDWEANGFEVVGFAEDGKQALDIISRTKPDIVLTDIKMPNMDGIELIERIKERYPTIRVIVLSCYNELDFIKRAMKLGADDYILKLSMQPEELLNVLKNTEDDIVSKKKALLQAGHQQKEIMQNKYFIKEDLYKKVVDNAISEEQLVEELKKIGTSLSFLNLSVIYTGIDEYSRASLRSRLKDRYLLKMSFINIVEEVISGYCNGDIVEIEKGEFLILLDFMEEQSYSQKILEEFCLKVNSALENYLNISASFGVSGTCGNMDNFRTMYTQAIRAFEQKFYYGRKSISFYDQKFEFSDKVILLNFHEEKMLMNCLENLDDEGAKAIIDRFFNDIYILKEYRPSKVRMAAIEILNSFIKVAKKFEIETEVILIISNNDEVPVDVLLKAETILDISLYFERVAARFVDYLSSKRLSAERPEILKLKQYISEKIYEDITLEKAAQISNMGKSYLSSVFKKETGEAFTDYVNRLKMEEAKVLIQRYGLKTYEVAEKLGFNDDSYFSKLFKKYIGISPSKVNR